MILLIASAVCAVSSTAAGQELVLAPGETFRYDFESLPYVGHHEGEPWTLVEWSYDRDSLNAGDMAYWGLWIGEALVWGVTVGLTEAPPDWSPGVGQIVAAPEKSGAIEITFLPESSGTLRIPGINISLDVQSASGGYDTYAAFVVPEPGHSLLLVFGVIGAYGCRVWCQTDGRGALPNHSAEQIAAGGRLLRVQTLWAAARARFGR